MKEHHVSIWFLIGLQFVIFGILIFGVSIYDIYVPPADHTAYEELHVGVYWGAIMFLLGLFYVIKFR